MKRILIILLIVIALFVVTNPSAKAFKEYLGNPEGLTIRRNYNFFVCSVYWERTPGISHDYYLGIFGNFCKL
jgi:hypothetical protein